MRWHYGVAEREVIMNNPSEVIGEGLRLLKKHDEICMKSREQIERGWLKLRPGWSSTAKRSFARPMNASSNGDMNAADDFGFSESFPDH
jgi:hypothetical protein